uniref:Uncharacterized protein n=1 Tax=Plectus sambesii TaxID=2011161 RepID=A0A914UH85_9BILA
MSGCNLQKLKEAIISLSSANDWEAAKLEWRLNYIYETDEPDTCLCGHHPIRQLCVLCNLVNGNKAVVGNVCVNKFMGIPSAKVFDAFRRVKKDSTCALNEKAIARSIFNSIRCRDRRTSSTDSTAGRVSKIDFSDAYLQIELNNESKRLAAINTYKGLLQYFRLAFGVVNASMGAVRE